MPPYWTYCGHDNGRKTCGQTSSLAKNNVFSMSGRGRGRPVKWVAQAAGKCRLSRSKDLQLLGISHDALGNRNWLAGKYTTGEGSSDITMKSELHVKLRCSFCQLTTFVKPPKVHLPTQHFTEYTLASAHRIQVDACRRVVECSKFKIMIVLKEEQKCQLRSHAVMIGACVQGSSMRPPVSPLQLPFHGCSCHCTKTRSFGSENWALQCT